MNCACERPIATSLAPGFCARCLRRLGWHHTHYGWHRGQRAAGDRYWPKTDAMTIAAAETEAGRTLWSTDPEWPL